MMELKTGHAALNSASERLDYPGMQARMQLACKDQILAALKKEALLGLGTRDLGLGLAGFLATIVATLVIGYFEEEGRKGLALKIAASMTGMLEDMDWTDAAREKENGQHKEESK